MWLKPILSILAGLVLFAAGVVAYGAWRWEAATSVLRTRLDAGRLPVTPRVYRTAELEQLPPQVQHYFQAVLSAGQPIVLSARVRHAGEFSTAPGRWRPFTSDQVVVTQRPGFDWNARVRMAPGVSVFVHDAYVQGEGILHASLLGLWTVADQRGTPEAASGELMRYLAEAAWYPTALLPSQGVRWEVVGAGVARGVLTDGTTTVALDFHFDADGLVSTIRAEARPRLVDGNVVSTPWEGRVWGYELRDGMLVPLAGEVAWLLPEGREPYWRGRVTGLAYEVAK